jgi:hypothetical protein
MPYDIPEDIFIGTNHPFTDGPCAKVPGCQRLQACKHWLPGDRAALPNSIRRAGHNKIRVVRSDGPARLANKYRPGVYTEAVLCVNYR